jgi:RNA polymerase sigma-70 factor (ECF subfamily)
MQNGAYLMSDTPPCSDDELMGQVATGQQHALGLLYQRYAPLIFHMASRSLDRGAAEEIVQEVFLAVWRGAATFDPSRGPVRPWILQIAHYRILNELRRQHRHPQDRVTSEEFFLEETPDDQPDPAEATWRAHRRTVLRAVFEQLSPPQRQALGLAFFEELTHEQVAAVLQIPLGTVKTRIRAGLQTLCSKLALQLGAISVVVLLALGGLYYQQVLDTQHQYDRALALVTNSETETLRLTSSSEALPDTHGRYRWRLGAPLIVVTLSHLPPASRDHVYQVWARYQAQWRSLGTVLPDTSGNARLIAEDAILAIRPEGVQVTLEPEGGSVSPRGANILQWSGD